MNHLRLLLCTAVVALSGLPTFAQTRPSPPTSLTTLPLPVALEAMPAATRDALMPVLKDPTITAVSKADDFVAHADMYQWLLDHPDRTSQAWRKLGIGAVEIKQLRDGRFVWRDDNGSELVWQSVARGPNGRVWYAEGKVKPAALSPAIPVTAVAVLNHTEKARATGDAVITHRIEIFMHTDSKAAALVTKLLGDSAPKMAQQGSEQLLMFFSGIAKYTHDKPEKAQGLLAEKAR